MQVSANSWKYLPVGRLYRYIAEVQDKILKLKGGRRNDSFATLVVVIGTEHKAQYLLFTDNDCRSASKEILPDSRFHRRYCERCLLHPL